MGSLYTEENQKAIKNIVIDIIKPEGKYINEIKVEIKTITFQLYFLRALLSGFFLIVKTVTLNSNMCIITLYRNFM